MTQGEESWGKRFQQSCYKHIEKWGRGKGNENFNNGIAQLKLHIWLLKLSLFSVLLQLLRGAESQ